MPLSEIDALEVEDKNSGVAPRAQYVLAEQVTRLVHGEEGLIAAKRITQSLFSGKLSDLSEDDFAQLAQDGMPILTVASDVDLQQAIVNAEFAPSKGQARTMIESNAISVNGERITTIDYNFSNNDKLFNRYTLLRRGKKYYCLLIWS